MRKSYIILAAFAIYGLIMIIGGTVYYVYIVREERLAAQAAARAAVTERLKETKTADSTPEAAAAKKAAEEHERQIKALEQEKEGLITSMQEDTVNGITYYHYKKIRQPDSGVYLYPSVGVGNGKCIMKLELYYFYSIDDPEQTAWVFGDRAELESAGLSTTVVLNPDTMVKHMAKDATYLSESHTVTLRDEAIAALRQMGDSGGTVVYYKQGGKSRTQQLNREQIHRLHDMVRLYDIFKAE